MNLGRPGARARQALNLRQRSTSPFPVLKGLKASGCVEIFILHGDILIAFKI